MIQTLGSLSQEYHIKASAAKCFNTSCTCWDTLLGLKILSAWLLPPWAHSTDSAAWCHKRVLVFSPCILELQGPMGSLTSHREGRNRCRMGIYSCLLAWPCLGWSLGHRFLFPSLPVGLGSLMASRSACGWDLLVLCHLSRAKSWNRGAVAFGSFCYHRDSTRSCSWVDGWLFLLTERSSSWMIRNSFKSVFFPLVFLKKHFCNSGLCSFVSAKSGQER